MSPLERSVKDARSGTAREIRQRLRKTPEGFEAEMQEKGTLPQNCARSC